MEVLRKRLISKHYFNQILSFLLILVLPTQLGKHFFLPFSYIHGVRVDYLSPTLYLIDILIIVLAVLNLKTVLKFLARSTFFYAAILFAFNIVLARSPILAAYGSLRILELLIVVSLGKTVLAAIGELGVLRAFSIAAFVELGLAVVQLIFKQSIQGPFYLLGERLMSLGTPGIAKTVVNGVEFLRPYATFSHPNSMAGFYLLLYFFVYVNRKFDKFPALKYLTMFLSACLVLISFSKTAIAVFLVLNIAYVFMNNKSICRICVISRLVILAVISSVFMFPQGDPMTITKRLELAANSLNIIITNPLTGTGLNNYLLAQSQFPSKFPYFFNQPVHNILLLFVSEMGFVGAFIIYQLVKMFKNHLTKNHWLLLAVILLTGMSDHYWLTLIQNFILMGVVLSFIGSQDHVLPGDSKPRSASAVRQSR